MKRYLFSSADDDLAQKGNEQKGIGYRSLGMDGNQFLLRLSFCFFLGACKMIIFREGVSVHVFLWSTIIIIMSHVPSHVTSPSVGSTNEADMHERWKEWKNTFFIL